MSVVKWSAGALPAPLNGVPGMKQLERAVNAFPVPEFDPRRYTASANGRDDDARDLQATLIAARAVAASPFGYRAPVVDLGGRTYLLNSGVTIPGGSAMTITNGRLVAGPSFPTSSYLLTCGQTSDTTLADGFKINDLTLSHLVLDNQHRGGGFLCQRYNRVTVDQCRFLGYQTHGLKTDVDGHELFLTTSRFGEYVWGDTSGTGYDRADLFVGTGVWFNTPDNHLHNCVIQLSLVGLKISEQANLVSMLHAWTGYVKTGSVGLGTAALSAVTTGVYVTATGPYCSFVGCYIDGCEFVMDDPWETSITSTKFLHGWGDPARSWIVFRPQAAGRSMKGVVITGCHFKVNDGGSIKAARVDTSAGTFAADVHNCAIKENQFSGSAGGATVTPFYTELRVRVEGVGVTTWTYDFSPYFPVGVVQSMHMTPYYYGGGLASSEIRVTNVAGNVVTCTTTGAQNASVYLWVDVNIMPS